MHRALSLLFIAFILASCVPHVSEPSETQGENLPLIQEPDKPSAGERDEPLRSPWQKERCSGSGPVELISPMRIDDIGIVLPMGAMIGGHVTPIDHMYFQPAIFNSAPDTYPVYADADGVIQGIGSEPMGNENRYRKYRLIIKHTCDFYSIYNLLTSLSPQILDVSGTIPPGGYSSKSISVKQGDLLGWIGGQTLDLSVNYDKVTLGFIVPEHYASEPWKIHTVDPFDYFKEPDKSALLAKNVRQAESRGGKIDYDVDGRLVGNWFVKGAGGHGDGGKNPEFWKNHLSFAYDPIDPTRVIVSLGNFTDIAKNSGLNERDRNMMQYGVKGNAPDPKDVSVATGLVKYELVETDYLLGDTNQGWSRMDYAGNIRAVGGTQVKGVVLAQLISERQLKMEIFPGKSASQVSGFVNPVVYER
ncbi:MAG: hypothetical protein Q7S65_05235 [Nanoarchaeota archaeon]|nr:hypothetical protein [Nanoarchaeota archaeon]